MSLETESRVDDELITPLEVDSATDQDSALGESRRTVTTSLSSSVQAFRYENGRRYHAFNEDVYFLPNDDIEAERLDLQHCTWKLTFDGGFGRVPLTDKVKTVLDVGTGTGIWAIELADAFPDKTVIGTDISPIQPDFVPPNCQFIIDNAEDEWIFDHKFDYIHSRMLTLGMHDWMRFFKQCWDHLEPGGWLETQEVQFPCRRADSDELTDSAFIRWGENVYEAARKAGIDARASENFTDQLRSQGFVNIERVDIQWPIRPWAKGKKNKIIGKLMYENTYMALPAIGMSLFTRHLGWTRALVEIDSMECRRDIDDIAKHFYTLVTLHVAQKPERAQA